MSTTLTTTEQEELPIIVDHITWVAGTKFTCVQDDCDREHHFWCSCAA